MVMKLIPSFESMRDLRLLRDARLLLHLLMPLFLHGIAHEICIPFLVDVISTALCPGKSTCYGALYLNSLHQAVSGLLTIAVLPLICELSDEYGRKPLLLLTISTSIFPLAVLSINQSKVFVYAYFVLRSLSQILSLRTIFCIAIAYAADVVEDDKKVAAFSLITGVISASHILGSVLAKFLPEMYIFELSIVLFILCLVYIQLFVAETVRRPPMVKQESPWSILLKPMGDRYRSIRYALTTVMTRPTLRTIYLISFFFEFGMSGISSVLLLYLKASFNIKKSTFSDMLVVVQIGSVFSQIMVVPLINALAGEKAILCMGLLASVTYAFFYSAAWESWLPYISVSLGLAYGFVKPAICAIISRASNSSEQGQAQGFVAAMDALASLISPFVMTPLAMWFLSDDPPFNCKGFSLIFAALSMMVALFCAMPLKPETTWNHDLKVVLLT